MTRYVAAFYWATMTTTTIGYGDVSPHGTQQRLLGFVAMIIGAMLVSVLVFLCSILSSKAFLLMFVCIFVCPIVSLPLSTAMGFRTLS